VITYLFLWLIFRIAGKRPLSESTTFDLVLLLIISESVQNALVANDYSMTGAALLVMTLVGADKLVSILSYRFEFFSKLVSGIPTIIFADGKPIEKRMKREQVQVNDILESARSLHGLESLEQIKYAVLERNGEISVIPK
jgi:uncharacterized membrane protein YcaP (DUF421 family)